MRFSHTDWICFGFYTFILGLTLQHLQLVSVGMDQVRTRKRAQKEAMSSWMAAKYTAQGTSPGNQGSILMPCYLMRTSNSRVECTNYTPVLVYVYTAPPACTRCSNQTWVSYRYTWPWAKMLLSICNSNFKRILGCFVLRFTKMSFYQESEYFQIYTIHNFNYNPQQLTQ